MSDEFFSTSYEEARSQFLAGAMAAHASCTALELPSDPSMTIDIARLGAIGSDNVFVHLSGTHGIEGFVGSAIQCLILKEIDFTQCPIEVQLVHAVNPVGMKLWRRCNENNVDLNRNMLESFQSLPPLVEGYSEIRSLVAPETVASSASCFLGQLAILGRKYGVKRILNDIAGGQYGHPEDLFFGGLELQASNRLLLDWIATSCRERKELAIVDVHSGLGAFGDFMAIVPPWAPGTIEEFALATVADVVRTPGTTGVWDVTGDLLSGLRRAAQPERCYALVQEFGTFGALELAHALALENQSFVASNNFAPEETVRRQRLLRALFVPSNITWRASVLQDGLALAERVIASLTINV